MASTVQTIQILASDEADGKAEPQVRCDSDAYPLRMEVASLCDVIAAPGSDATPPA